MRHRVKGLLKSRNTACIQFLIFDLSKISFRSLVAAIILFVVECFRRNPCRYSQIKTMLSRYVDASRILPGRGSNEISFRVDTSRGFPSTIILGFPCLGK